MEKNGSITRPEVFLPNIIYGNVESKELNIVISGKCLWCNLQAVMLVDGCSISLENQPSRDVSLRGICENVGA